MMDRQTLTYIALACSLLLNVVLLVRGPSDEVGDEPVAESPAAGQTGDASDADDRKQVDADDDAADSDAGEDDAGADAGEDDGGGAEGMGGEWTLLRGEVQASLARTFQIEAGEDGDALASVFTRLFVWDVDMRRHLQKGDSLAVIWREGADGFPEIAAASLTTSRLGKPLTAFRWKAPDDQYASYWHSDGTEAALRLKGGPLDNYEQITSLLKDRPTHKGMDFKTPVGTEVTSPRAGTVTRVNWNWGANGNCVEIKFDDGVLAKFLHLSENRVKEGDSVKAGQVIALSGNTGRSTAPHLHYQLDRGTTTLDPLDYHGTERRKLPEAQRDAMLRDVAEFKKALEEEDEE